MKVLYPLRRGALVISSPLICFDAQTKFTFSSFHTITLSYSDSAYKRELYEPLP